MKKILTIVTVCSAMTASALSLHAGPVEIVIDCSAKLVRGSEPLRYGICMKYLIDSDEYDSTRRHTIRESLRNLKVRADQSLKGCQIDNILRPGVARMAIVRTTLIHLIVVRFIIRVVHTYGVKSRLCHANQPQHQSKRSQIDHANV